MTKSKFNLRNLAKITVACLVVSMMFVACSKDKDKDKDNNGGLVSAGKLSPPAWLHGNWGWEHLYYKITSNDVILVTSGIEVSYKTHYNIANTSLKETKKTADIYELTYSITGYGVMGSWVFNKGDGTYIDITAFEETEELRFPKL